MGTSSELAGAKLGLEEAAGGGQVGPRVKPRAGEAPGTWGRAPSAEAARISEGEFVGGKQELFLAHSLTLSARERRY